MNARSDALSRMEEVMGPPVTDVGGPALDVETHEEERLDGVSRRRISYAAEPGVRIPAYLLVPERPLPGRPSVVCFHQTTAVGKAEPAGVRGREDLHYGLELARRGFLALAPDAPSFGELTEVDPLPDHYSSGTMRRIHVHRRGVELLASRPDAREDRIGAVGHSLGGHSALFTAAFDSRIVAVVTSCGFDTWHHYADRHGSLDAWAQPRYMPRIRDRYGGDPDRIPFDFPDVLAALAPRGLFVSAPLNDDNFDHRGVRECLDRVRPRYEAADAAERLRAAFPDAGHSFPESARRAAYEFLSETLAGE